MRAAGIDEPSGTVLPLDLPAPGEPGGDELLLDVRAAGVGNWDDLMRTGAWPSGLALPHALGVEGAGVVRAVGHDVTEFVAGDEVMVYVFPFRGGGTWAQQVRVPAGFAGRKSAALSWTEAAALPVPALTAYQVVHELLAVSAGQRLLVNGAGGVTGGLIVQLALAAGAEVVATAGPGSADRLRAYGSVEVLDHGRVPAASVELAVNAARGGSRSALNAVADGGSLISITDPPPDPQRGIRAAYHVVRPDAGQLTLLGLAAGKGEIRPPAVRAFALQDAGDALITVRAGSRGAAVALRV
jgi:NADPH:quinone reductase-like Zn-dependent oxidoreductase